jgi:hypothetical protein
VIASTVFSALALIAPQPHTAWSGGQVQAFALDGSRMAWISGVCRTVRVRKVSGGTATVLGDAKLTECDDRGTPMVALAGRRVLWTEQTFGNFTYTYVLTNAAADHRAAKRLDYLVHQNDLDGDWVTALAGDGGTLLYVDLVVAGRTLPDDTDVYFADRGSLRNVVRRSVHIVRQSDPPFRIAVSGGRVAVVYADRAQHQAAILRSSYTVRVLDLSGSTISTITTGRRPRAVALAPPYVVLLDGSQLDLYRYNTPTGTLVRSSDPVFSGPALDAAGLTVIGRSGRRIWTYDIASGSSRQIATAASTPIGLSIEGHTVAWAENVRSGGRIRSLTLR